MAANDTAANGLSSAVVAVGEVRDALPAPDLTGLKLSVDSQTHAVGVIHPPPDIRAIVDKTAQFVAKNGVEFEKRIVANERDNVKFNFLKSTDPYHKYYQLRVEEFKQGDGAAAAPAATPAQAAAAAQAAAKPAAAPTSILAPQEPLKPPEDEQYTVHVPEGLRLQDLDLVKLTAQFVARNGKGFLTDLAMKETRNQDFNFLKPTHSMFTFFTALCDSYSKVLMPPAGTSDKLRRDATDRQGILERCLKRLEWDKVQSREAKAAADAKEAERLAMQSIDWHDFVVVETIDFYEDEEAELPPPMSLRDVQALNKAAPFGDEAEDDAEGEGKEDAEIEMEMDDEERQLVQDANAQAGEAAPDAAPPVPQDEDEDIMVVKDYQRPDPRARAAAASATKMVLSPITGEMIPVDQMAEHMRISLIDPRWKQQRDAMLSKIRDTTKASDDEISRNLVGLARSRPDVFGSTQEEVSSMVAESVREAQISGSDRTVVWDGSARGEGLKNQIQSIRDQQAEQTAKAPQLASLPPPPAVRPGPASAPQAGASPAAPTMASLPPPPAARPSPAQLPAPPKPAGGAPPPVLAPPVARPMPPRPPPGMAPPGMGLPRPPPGFAPPGFPPGGFGMPPRPPPGMGLPGMPRPLMPPSAGAPGAPTLPSQAPPPMPEEPAAKRQRVSDFVLQPEDEFMAAHSGTSKIMVQVPEVEGNEVLQGQVLAVEVAGLTDSLGTFKARLAEVLKQPANRLQLSREGVGFLKDQFSLGFYNVSEEIQLQLSIRQRGGRK